jgi:hypothetical protein
MRSVWPFRRRGQRLKHERRSPRGRWEAPIDRLHEGIAEVEVITFEDGSRWEGLWVVIPDGQSPDQAVEEIVQSLIDQGELESCLTRVDDPVSTVVAWFRARKLGLVVERDEAHGDWVARVTQLRGGRVLQARYGSGPTAAEAALRAQERYGQEQ